MCFKSLSPADSITTFKGNLCFDLRPAFWQLCVLTCHWEGPQLVAQQKKLLCHHSLVEDPLKTLLVEDLLTWVIQGSGLVLWQAVIFSRGCWFLCTKTLEFYCQRALSCCVLAWEQNSFLSEMSCHVTKLISSFCAVEMYQSKFAFNFQCSFNSGEYIQLANVWHHRHIQPLPEITTFKTTRLVVCKWNFHQCWR